MAIVQDTEGSRLAQPARRAPATQPHTRVSGLLGLVTAALLVAVIIGAQADRDGEAGERMIAGAASAVITGLGYVATRVQWRPSIQDLRESYRLGRRVERTVSRKRSSH